MKMSEDRKKTGSRKKNGIISVVKESVSSMIEEIKADGKSLRSDLLVFTVGFLLARCQLLLGARPIGIAFIALLNKDVWPALLGVAVGSGSLGADGIVYTVAAVITALLRIVTSLSEKRERGEGELFQESLLLRISVSVISAFLIAVYEALMRGLNEATLLYGLVMIILTPLLTFILSGLCRFKTGIWDVIKGSKDVLSLSHCETEERRDRILFQISSLALIFFISLSFKSVNILGISPSFVFTSLIALVVAKRFGALRGMAVGLISSLPLSAELSVGYALAGLCSGVMISFGSGYAVIGGGVALCAWSIYTSGMVGLLTTVPEYIIAAAIAIPLLRGVKESRGDDSADTYQESSTDMVGTMALAYQRDYSGSVDNLEEVLSELAQITRKYTFDPIRLSFDEYQKIVIDSAEKICIGCERARDCSGDDVRPVIKYADSLADKLCDGESIAPSDLCVSKAPCFNSTVLAEEINREAGRREQEKYLRAGICGPADDFELIGRLVGQAIASDDAELNVNNDMTEPLTDAFESFGFNGGTIRAFGNHRQHFILAAEDESGKKISSFELRKSIESTAGVKLGAPEYFRRGRMALMECGIRPSYRVSYATVSEAGNKNEVSGDTSLCFELSNGYFYSLISDGMGSGGLAKKTSEFVGEFIKTAMRIGTGKETVIHLLNHSIRTRGEECSATVDMLELDLWRGGGTFIKSGAPPSYVKRGSSIFRIKSQTAPIGLMRSIDTEKISVEIKKDDYVIMLSDGVAEIAEDAPWLLLLLAEDAPSDLKEYANRILSEAKLKSSCKDDMTVTVIKISDV